MQPIALLWLGLLLGLRHAADPDHVVAIGAIAARSRRLWPSTVIGMVWGLGHTLTLFMVAGGMLLFNWVVPPRLGLALEFCVAIALIVVGVLNVRASEHDRPADLAVTGARRAFFVGLVHGLAGSAAVALLVLATVDNARWGFAYLLVFGAGTMIGMMLITTGLAVPVAAVSNHRHGGHWIRFATGGLSLVMGVWLAYRIGWHDGLFLAAPIWTPR